jgi:hypothetical protein
LQSLGLASIFFSWSGIAFGRDDAPAIFSDTGFY